MTPAPWLMLKHPLPAGALYQSCPLPRAAFGGSKSRDGRAGAAGAVMLYLEATAHPSPPSRSGLDKQPDETAAKGRADLLEMVK